MIRTRALEPHDWETFRSIRLEALAESPDAYGSTLERERDADEASWRGWLTGDGWDAVLTAFVADDDRAPAGIAVCARFRGDPSVAHLLSMWVRPPSRGRGLGRALVSAVVDRAGSLGVETLALRVTEGNVAAAHLYASCGFVPTPDPPQPLREGSRLTTIEMRLQMPDRR